MNLIRSLIFAALLSLITQRAALAHPLTQGSLGIIHKGGEILLTMRVPFEEIIAQQSADITESSPQRSREEIWLSHGLYILKHLSIDAHGRQLLGKITPGTTPTQDASFISYSFSFKAPKYIEITEISLRQDILQEVEYTPGNPWEASFIVTNGDSATSGATYLLTPSASLLIPLKITNSSSTSLFIAFVWHGVLHILEGRDHLLFAAALVLSTLVFWDVVKVIAAFTLAHTLTLALSVLELVRLSSSVVEPAIALSIVVVALLNVFTSRQRAIRTTMVLAFFFGLFHGLGFAGGLLDAMSGLQSVQFWIALIGFSVGVEIGHQVVVLPLYAFLSAVRRVDFIRGTSLTPKLVRLMSVAVMLGGAYFLLQII